MKTGIKYFFRTEREFNSVPDARDYQKEHPNTCPSILIMGYYIPQPVYHSWVPKWLIRLITTKL